MVRRFLAIALLSMPLTASAALLPTFVAPLSIEAVPDAPRPGATVYLTAVNYSAHVGDTTYVWTVNGKVVDQGLGRNKIVVTMGAVGSVTDVMVTATEGTTDRGTATLTLTPAGVDLLWEGATYVPPLSGILPLPNGSSRVTVVAVPEIPGVTAGGAVYTWRVNDAQTVALSGRGQSVFTLSPPRFSNPFSVSVEVTSPDGSIRATRSVVIDPVDPSVVIYEIAPLIGTRFDRAIEGDFRLSDEATFEAFPLYVSLASAKDPTATGGWTVNGAPSDSTTREITVRKTGNGSGQYSLGFFFKSAVDMFSNGDSTFTVSF